MCHGPHYVERCESGLPMQGAQAQLRFATTDVSMWAGLNKVFCNWSITISYACACRARSGSIDYALEACRGPRVDEG